MKTFKYTAVNLDKEEFTGTFIAKDESDLAEQLAKQGLFLVSSSQYSGRTPSAFFTLGTGKISAAELTRFCSQFSIMINTGIAMRDILECLKEQHYSSYFKKIISIVCEDVKSGNMLSASFEKHGKAFPAFFINMVKVGENSGRLDTVFASLAEYYEKTDELRRKRLNAMLYPLMLFLMTLGVAVLMLTFVVPRFRDVLSKLNVEINGSTKAVYDISDFMLNNWLYLIAGLVLIILALVLFGKTKRGARFYDKIKIRLPLFGKVNVYQAAASFARGFGLLLNSGMDMSEAMDGVKIVIENRDIRARFELAAEEVRHGMSFSYAMEKHKVFPKVMIQMLAIGERTASISDIMLRSCKFFEDQVSRYLNSATALLQPVMLLILAAVVMLLFLAVYSPMISIMNGLI